MKYETQLALAASYARKYAKQNPGESDSSIAWEAEYFLKHATKADWTFGTESVSTEFCDDDHEEAEAEYINVGDSYGETILVEAGEVQITSWADWLESKEAAYAEAAKRTKCSNCGTWVRTAEEWRESECGCGHYVDGSEIPSAESVLPGFTDCGDGDYQHLFRQNELLPTHETPNRQTLLFVRLLYIREYESSFPHEYHCEIMAVNPSMSVKARREAAESYGMEPDEFEAGSREVQAEIMLDCGFCAVLWQESGDHKIGLLKQAAKQLPEINLLCGFKLDAPQNAIGTSGWDFMRGGILAGLRG